MEATSNRLAVMAGSLAACSSRGTDKPFTCRPKCTLGSGSGEGEVEGEGCGQVWLNFRARIRMVRVRFRVSEARHLVSPARTKPSWVS